MKNLLIVGLIGLASCQSSGLTYRAAEIGGGLGTYDEDSDDTFGNAVNTRVSVLLQQEDMPIGGVSEQNHAKGFVTEVGLNSSNATGEVVVPGAGLFAGPQTFTTNLDYLEGDAGLRYYLDTGTKFFQPYLGVGAGVRYSQISVGSASTDAMSVGLKAKVGADIALGNNFRIGGHYQQSFGHNPKFEGIGTDMDDSGFFVNLGWSF